FMSYFARASARRDSRHCSACSSLDGCANALPAPTRPTATAKTTCPSFRRALLSIRNPPVPTGHGEAVEQQPCPAYLIELLNIYGDNGLRILQLSMQNLQFSFIPTRGRERRLAGAWPGPTRWSWRARALPDW